MSDKDLDRDLQDLKEFANTAQDGGLDNTEERRAIQKKHREAWGNSDDDELDERRPLTSEYTQWSKNGEGFTQVGQTFAKLDPGVYKLQQINHIWSFVPKKLTTDKLIRLPDTQSERVMRDIEKFWSEEVKAAFKLFGFVHKRGILLHGPPGSGKTATLEQVLDFIVKLGGLGVLCDTNPNVIAALFARTRQVEPNRPIVAVMEDIDAIIDIFGESELLSLLDGEQSINNVLFLATTNYPEKLDKRIANRPSRFDKVIKIDLPSTEARYVYFKSRNLPLTDKELRMWAEKTEKLSIAHLKEIIIGVYCFNNTFEKQLEVIRLMGKRVSSEDNEQKLGFGG